MASLILSLERIECSICKETASRNSVALLKQVNISIVCVVVEMSFTASLLVRNGRELTVFSHLNAWSRYGSTPMKLAASEKGTSVTQSPRHKVHLFVMCNMCDSNHDRPSWT